MTVNLSADAERAHDDRSLTTIAEVAMVGAAVLVGIAIVLEGPAARALNGIGAVVWVASTLIMIWSLRTVDRIGLVGSVAAVAAVVLAVVVRPNDVVSALLGFGIAGAVVALTARERELGFALLVPAIFLPVHLSLAIGRVIIAGSTTVRTDPPPTAPLVPLTMVIGAALAGLVVAWWRRRVA